MSATRDPDRILRAWLDLMPDEAPDRVFDAVLQVVDATPQVRRTRRWPLWRSTPMNRWYLAAGSAAIVIVAGLLLLPRASTGPNVGGPSPSTISTPTSTPSHASIAPSTAAAGPLPAELLGRWMGGHRDFAEGGAGTSIVFTTSGYEMDQSNDTGNAQVRGQAASVSGGKLRLTAPNGYACDAITVGTYSWTLSSSGRVLTVALEQDACAGRARDMPGTYWLMACRDRETNCLGDLDAGTYSSQYIRPLLQDGATWSPLFGGVTYAVPDGWANYSDWPGVLGLTTSTDFAKTTPSDTQPITKLTVSTHAQPVCVSGSVASAPASPEAAFADLRNVKGLTVGTVRSLTIAGDQAAYADLTVDSANAGCGGTEVGYLVGGGDTLAIGAGERQRLYLVDVGDAGLVAIWVAARDATSFAQVVTPAVRIVESMQFK